MTTGPCQWGYGCGREGGNDGTGRYWFPNLCAHLWILYRNGVKDPSTEEFDSGHVTPWRDWGILILYKEYIEGNLTIQDLSCHNEDVLLLFILDNKYGERIPVETGTQVIDHLVVTMTEKELQQAEET